jgi:hypothetical protein
VKKTKDMRGQGLSGNSIDRRAEFRRLQKKYGKGNVVRINNPNSKASKTRVEVSIPDVG